MDDDLDPVWRERFRLDVEEDLDCERRLLWRALVIALVVAALAVSRWAWV
jgi:hypothetical protein